MSTVPRPVSWLGGRLGLGGDREREVWAENGRAHVEARAIERPEAAGLRDRLRQRVENRQLAIRALATGAGATAAWLTARATGSAGRARTTALVGLVGAQLGQTLLVGGRSPLVAAAALGSLGALAAVVQAPGVSHFFGCRPQGPLGWSIGLGSAAAATARAAVASAGGLPRTPKVF